MDRDRTRPETGAAAVFHERLQPGRILVIALVPILLLASVAFVRASGITAPSRLLLAGSVANLTPQELAAAAADLLESATATGGAGYTFEIVQHGTIVAKSDGPPLEIEDPDDPTTTRTVASHLVGTYLERGSVTPAGFHAEIRRGSDDPAASPDWDKQPMELAALVIGGTTYRNDGQGWYQTDRPPGIGLDPSTAALLPTMLRGLDGPTDAAEPGAQPSASPEPGRAAPDPFAAISPARRLEGESNVADIPGIIAVDLADATELRGPAELAFDETGRLIGLRVLARNTHLDPHDLLVETVITFTYTAAAPELPKPEPRWVAPSAPADGE